MEISNFAALCTILYFWCPSFKSTIIAPTKSKLKDSDKEEEEKIEYGHTLTHRWMVGYPTLLKKWMKFSLASKYPSSVTSHQQSNFKAVTNPRSNVLNSPYGNKDTILATLLSTLESECKDIKNTCTHAHTYETHTGMQDQPHSSLTIGIHTRREQVMTSGNKMQQLDTSKYSQACKLGRKIQDRATSMRINGK